LAREMAKLEAAARAGVEAELTEARASAGARPIFL
jgi:hypothetical protein